MDKDLVSVYKNDCSIVKIKKANIKLQNQDKLPCLCFAEKLVGIAKEYNKEEEVYLVDISKNKIFSSTFVKDDGLPTKEGAELYMDSTGHLTGNQDTSNQLVGIFLGIEGGATLFKLI
ncbi:MAG: hypothetical protein ACTTKH_04440 [Treponema sp.]